jgi:hypothetical protein
MLKKLFGVAVLTLVTGFAAKPAPAIEFICSCARCTSPTSGLGCHDFDHSPSFTSCGQYHIKYC